MEQLGDAGLVQDPHKSFIDAAQPRVRRIAEALAEQGSTVVLTGEPGAGKSFLAQAAASVCVASASHPTKRLVVRTIEDLMPRDPGTPRVPPLEQSTQIQRYLAEQFPSTDLVIVARSIDTYNAADSATLEHLVRSQMFRIIGTADELSGAADRLARNPDVHQLVASPLTLEETNQLLSNLLNVDSFTADSTGRWHEETRGNVHALITLALAADKRGVVNQANRVGWVALRDHQAPSEFITQIGDLTSIERATLDLVAYASPLREPALLRLLDADTVAEMLARRIFIVHTDVHGSTALTTRLPITAEAVRAQLSPVTRAKLATMCFDALNAAAQTTTVPNSGYLRVVRFGLDSGSEVPPAWVWLAMRESTHTKDFWLTLDLAIAAMTNDDVERSADAIMRACELAYFLGDYVAFDRATDALKYTLATPETLAQLTNSTQIQLRLTSIYLNSMQANDPAYALEELERAEQDFTHRDIDASHAVHAYRTRILALHGHLRAAMESAESHHFSRDLETEFISLPAQVYAALIFTQRGSFKHSLELSQTARQFSLLHNDSPAAAACLETFSMFLTHWARGTTHAAERVLVTLSNQGRSDISAAYSCSGLIDLAVMLFAVQEGRWSDAAGLSGHLIRSLTENDPFGVLTLAQAATALTLAVLGASEAAQTALDETEYAKPGLSLALKGFVSTLSLRARHWLRDPRLLERALEVAVWAREERLALIELEALGIAAHEIDEADPQLLRRAHVLASRIDSHIGDAILAHIHVLTHDAKGVEPEERLLSELGMWLPLPPVPHLTGREREIALFTALGYPSKHVAERLHISARTIETHLANVYTKLGLTGREELRHWFTAQREWFSAERETGS